jgi:hypothetical protein
LQAELQRYRYKQRAEIVTIFGVSQVGLYGFESDQFRRRLWQDTVRNDDAFALLDTSPAFFTDGDPFTADRLSPTFYFWLAGHRAVPILSARPWDKPLDPFHAGPRLPGGALAEQYARVNCLYNAALPRMHRLRLTPHGDCTLRLDADGRPSSGPSVTGKSSSRARPPTSKRASAWTPTGHCISPAAKSTFLTARRNRPWRKATTPAVTRRFFAKLPGHIRVSPCTQGGRYWRVQPGNLMFIALTAAARLAVNQARGHWMVQNGDEAMRGKILLGACLAAAMVLAVAVISPTVEPTRAGPAGQGVAGSPAEGRPTPILTITPQQARTLFGGKAAKMILSYPAALFLLDFTRPKLEFEFVCDGGCPAISPDGTRLA